MCADWRFYQLNNIIYILSTFKGDGLLFASGQKWLRNRKLLTPGFHSDILKAYIEISKTAGHIMLVCYIACNI